MRTINVIEIPDIESRAFSQLLPFVDDEGGNQRAETVFKKLVRENYDVTDEELETALENGYFERDSYYVAIVHSTAQKLSLVTIQEKDGDDIIHLGSVYPPPSLTGDIELVVQDLWGQWCDEVPEPEADSDFIEWLVKHGWAKADDPIIVTI